MNPESDDRHSPLRAESLAHCGQPIMTEAGELTPAVSARPRQRLGPNKKLVGDPKSGSKSRAALASHAAKKMPAGLRREQIVSVLLSLMSERSPGEISTQLIADTAGVSQATIFKHFSTKAELWAATAHWLGTELDKIWIRSHADIASDKALLELEHIFLGMVEFFVRYPAVVRIMMSDCLRREFLDVLEISQALHQRYQREVVWLLELATQSRTVNGALDRNAAATLFFCCIRGLGFQLATSSHNSNFQEEARDVLHLYLNAIGARRS